MAATSTMPVAARVRMTGRLGAERLKDAFDQIAATARARHGDARVETYLLRKARITIRFGILNNCLFDERHPAGAVCLENAIFPYGHTGPLEDRCRPDRCPNSMREPSHETCGPRRSLSASSCAPPSLQSRAQQTSVWLVTGLRPAAALTAGAIAAASSVRAALISRTVLYLVPTALLWASPVRRLTTMPTPAPLPVKDSAHAS